MIPHPTMPAHPLPEITLIILRPALNTIVKQIRRTSVIAIMSADAMAPLEPAHPGTCVAVPAVVESSGAVCVEAVGHGLYGDGETEVFAVCGDALLVGPVGGRWILDWSVVAAGKRGCCCESDEGGEEEDVGLHLDGLVVGLESRLRESRLGNTDLGRSEIRYDNLGVFSCRD